MLYGIYVNPEHFTAQNPNGTFYSGVVHHLGDRVFLLHFVDGYTSRDAAMSAVIDELRDDIFVALRKSLRFVHWSKLFSLIVVGNGYNI